MRRTFTVIALVLATAGPAAAQSTSSQGQSNCPIARMTLLGAAVGFGAGASIGFGLNVFEDTVNGEGKAWMTVIWADGRWSLCRQRVRTAGMCCELVQPQSIAYGRADRRGSTATESHGQLPAADGTEAGRTSGSSHVYVGTLAVLRDTHVQKRRPDQSQLQVLRDDLRRPTAAMERRRRSAPCGRWATTIGLRALLCGSSVPCW
jgi:hypothetical protein